MTKLNEKRVGVISLGCDKNRVDSEKMLAILNERYVVTNDISTANIVIINTCAFLESARAEAISTIFEVNEYRASGNLEKIIVTGCLPQKFANDIFEDLFEVDAFLGINDYDLIHSAIESIYLGNRVNFVGKNKIFYIYPLN